MAGSSIIAYLSPPPVYTYPSVSYSGDIMFESRRGTDHPDGSFCSFTQFLPENTGIVPQVSPWLLPFVFFVLCHSLIILPFDATYSELLIAPIASFSTPQRNKNTLMGFLVFSYCRIHQ
jgi:hypothetical protein